MFSYLRFFGTSAVVLLLLSGRPCAAQSFLDTVLEKMEGKVARRNEQEPPDAKAIREARDVCFTIGVGDGLYGFDTVSFSSKRTATQIFYREFQKVERGRKVSYRRWYVTTFSIAEEDLVAMRQELEGLRDFFGNSSYSLEKVADGTSVFLKLTLDEEQHRVFTNNHFPDEIRSLHASLKKRFGERMIEAMKDGRELPSGFRSDEKWRDFVYP